MPTDDLPLPRFLLLLADQYTRHNDALTELTLDPLTPQTGLQADIPATQRLARTTLAMIDKVKSARLLPTPDVRDVEIRLRQLAFLTAAAADHLIDAKEIIDDARDEEPGFNEEDHPYRHALMDAAMQLRTARDLTALAPDTAAQAAEALTIAARRQGLNATSPLQGPPITVSPAQQEALRAVVRGHVEVYEAAGRLHVSSHTDQVLLATVRSLESKELIRSDPRPSLLNRQRVRLTAQGRQTLVATYGRPRPSALRALAATKATRTVASTARSR